MDIIAFILFAFIGVGTVDVVANDGATLHQVDQFLQEEVGRDLLGVEDPNQKYRWGNTTVDVYGNLKVAD